MRILGIDPGTIRMGYGVVEGEQELTTLHWGIIKAKSSQPLHERLHCLYGGLQQIIQSWKPSVVAIEEPFVGREDRQYVQAALAIGQAQAVALIVAVEAQTPIFRYSPALIKKEVADHGAATKEQVQQMVRVLLNLEETPAPSDAADALGVAICHWRQQSARDLLEIAENKA